MIKKSANSTPREKLVFALLDAASRIERKLDRALSCTRGVSFTEYHLLKQLSDVHDGAATRVDLASSVNLTPSAVTRALKPLEKLGYVNTVKSDRDARRSIASLTAGGKELLDDANGIIQDEIAALPLAARGNGEMLEVLDGLSGR